MDPNNLTKKEITMQNVKTRKMKIKPCESRIVFVTCRRIGAGKSFQKVFKQCRVVSYSIQAEEFRQFFLKNDVSQQKEKTSQVTCYKRKK